MYRYLHTYVELKSKNAKTKKTKSQKIKVKPAIHKWNVNWRKKYNAKWDRVPWKWIRDRRDRKVELGGWHRGVRLVQRGPGREIGTGRGLGPGERGSGWDSDRREGGGGGQIGPGIVTGTDGTASGAGTDGTGTDGTRAGTEADGTMDGHGWPPAYGSWQLGTLNLFDEAKNLQNLQNTLTQHSSHKRRYLLAPEYLIELVCLYCVLSARSVPGSVHEPVLTKTELPHLGLPVAARGPQSTRGPDPVPSNHCFYDTYPLDLVSETLTFGRPSCKIFILSGKGVFPLWPLSERLFYRKLCQIPTFSLTYVGAAHSILGLLSSIAIGCNKLHSLQQSNSTDTTDQSSKTHRSQPLYTQVPKLTGRRPCGLHTASCQHTPVNWRGRRRRYQIRALREEGAGRGGPRPTCLVLQLAGSCSSVALS